MQAVKSWERRSWKREVASFLLVVWSVATLRLFLWPATIEFIAAISGIYGMLTPAVFAFAAASFGFDAWVKQIRDNPLGPTHQSQQQGAASTLAGTKPVVQLP